MKTVIAFLLFGGLQLAAQDMQSCPMHKEHMKEARSIRPMWKSTVMRRWGFLMTKPLIISVCTQTVALLKLP